MHTTRRWLLAAIVLLAAVCPAVLGQGNADIYLVTMVVEGNAFRFSVPVNITNRPGSDSDPAFLGDRNALLYASHRGGQGDIYLYDVETSATTQLTDTPETEFDPRPGRTRGSFSALRLEADRQMRLWSFPLEGDESPALLVPDAGPAVRHAWGFNDVVGFVVLGDTTTLQIADLGSGERFVVDRQIDGGVAKVPQQRALSYVKQRDEGRSIERYDISNNFADRVARPPVDQTEHVWLMDPSSNLWILAPKGPVIYAWQLTTQAWKPVVDFSGSGITSITRLSVSPDATLLAFAAERPAK